MRYLLNWHQKCRCLAAQYLPSAAQTPPSSSIKLLRAPLRDNPSARGCVPSGNWVQGIVVTTRIAAGYFEKGMLRAKRKCELNREFRLGGYRHRCVFWLARRHRPGRSANLGADYPRRLAGPLDEQVDRAAAVFSRRDGATPATSAEPDSRTTPRALAAGGHQGRWHRDHFEMKDTSYSIPWHPRVRTGSY